MVELKKFHFVFMIFEGMNKCDTKIKKKKIELRMMNQK